MAQKKNLSVLQTSRMLMSRCLPLLCPQLLRRLLDSRSLFRPSRETENAAKESALGMAAEWTAA